MDIKDKIEEELRENIDEEKLEKMEESIKEAVSQKEEVIEAIEKAKKDTDKSWIDEELREAKEEKAED